MLQNITQSLGLRLFGMTYAMEFDHEVGN